MITISYSYIKTHALLTNPLNCCFTLVWHDSISKQTLLKSNSTNMVIIPNIFSENRTKLWIFSTYILTKFFGFVIIALKCRCFKVIKR